MAHVAGGREDPAALLEQFAAVLAHEVRNPLNALAMNAEVASMLIGTDRAREVPKVLERIGRDVRRCAEAIRELSAVVALDVPGEGIALDELLAATADRLRGGAAGVPLEVEVGGSDAPLAFAANRAAIEFALAQVARTVVARGVRGVRLALERGDDGCWRIDVERLPGTEPGPAGAERLSPTRVAAYAIARHALEAAGASLEPEVLEEIPQRCRIRLPAGGVNCEAE